MARSLRAVGLAVLLAVSASPALAADPTAELGGRISPSRIEYPRDKALRVVNLSTIPVVVDVTTNSTGWAVGPSGSVLEPNETLTVPITAAGAQDGLITAALSPADDVPGMDQNSLELSALAIAPGTTPDVVPALAILVAALVLFLVVLRLMLRLLP